MDTRTQELRDRIDAKTKRVEAKIHELKADASANSRKKSEELERKLAEVRADLKGGFGNLKDGTLDKINAWLSE